jgi:peptide/nickel transport system permease protein
MKRQKGIIFLMLFMGLLWIVAFFCSRLTPNDPFQINLLERLIPPSLTYLCGTDELGRDIFSRILLGFSSTIKVSVMTLFSSFFIGVVTGSIAGIFYNRFLDRIFNWIASMLFSLPFLLMISALMSLIEKNLLNAYLVMTAIIWVGPARIIRAGVIQAKSSGFVIAERAMGKSERAILFESLIPMSIRPAFIFSFRYFPEIVGMEAGLSFLGLGVQPPHPGLGKMIFDSINYLQSAWWYALFPSLFLFIIVLGSNLFYLQVSKKIETY